MKANEIIDFTAELIAIPSISGDEGQVARFLSDYLTSQGWAVEKLPVAPGRENLFAAIGVPEVVFTTHIDVVPAPADLFRPRREGNRLIGRGACDAKGIAATMIGVCSSLRKRGMQNFAMLFVVGEEMDGIGAKAAAKLLQGRGIRYLINGEPTDGVVASGHKGSISLDATFEGKAAHSGYPQYGIDANAKLVRTASRLLAAHFGSSEVLGPSSVHCGMLHGGVAGNVISPSAFLSCSVRTVSDNALVIEQARSLCEEAAEIKITYDCPPVFLRTIVGMKSAPMSYATDIPYFSPLGAEALLYGPGSILCAHTDEESISLDEIEGALEGYERILQTLRDELRSEEDR